MSKDIDRLIDKRDDLLNKKSDITHSLDITLGKKDMLEALIMGIGDVFGDEDSPLIIKVVQVFEKEDEILKELIDLYTKELSCIEFDMKVLKERIGKLNTRLGDDSDE